MELSKRLKRIADNVKTGGIVADIGCDHGFTSIYLIQKGIAQGAIALDINRKPLLRAKEHICHYGLSDKIQLRLSDGAKELKPGEADTMLISGMGGALTAKILRENLPVTQSVQELVLSPQSEIYLVRHCLHELGFRMDKEEMVYDRGKYYVIIHAIPGKEKYDREEDYTYGRKLIENRDCVFQEFLKKEEKRVDKILAVLSGQLLSEKSMQQKEMIAKEKAQLADIRNRMSRKEK